MKKDRGKIKNLVLTTIFVLPFYLNANAQLSLAPVGARAAGLANITTIETDIWSAINNPGSLGVIKDFGIGILHEQRFLMEEMGVSSIVGAFPLFGNSVGIYLSNLGFSTYGQNRFGLSIGRQIGEFISVGVGVDAHLLRFPEDYSNLFSINGNVGVWANPAENLTLGLYVFNLTFSKWNDEENSPLPIVFSLGASYKITEQILLCAELTKDIDEAARVKIATEFNLVKTLFLRVGVISEPFEMHFGIGYNYKNLQFDLALSRHPVLGYTPQVGISIKL
jgi:hypothetical protein